MLEFDKEKKLVCGVGVMDVPGALINHREAYRRWANMINRAYNPKTQERNPTYIGCSVCSEWLTFSNFLAWFNALTDEQKGWSLGKDLLFPGNTEYSPATCIMAPPHLNVFTIDSGRSRGEYPIGVCRHKRTAKYQSHITVNGKRKYLGCFPTPEAAHEAWREAKIALVHNMREELDAIDPRLYSALLSRYGYSMAVAA